jgi:hypothetical protein
LRFFPSAVRRRGGVPGVHGSRPGGGAQADVRGRAVPGLPARPRQDAILQLGEAICVQLGAGSRFPTPAAGEAVAGRIFTHSGRR